MTSKNNNQMVFSLINILDLHLKLYPFCCETNKMLVEFNPCKTERRMHLENEIYMGSTVTLLNRRQKQRPDEKLIPFTFLTFGILKSRHPVAIFLQV